MTKNPVFLALAALPAFALPAWAQGASESKPLSAVTVVGKAPKDGQRAPNLATGVADSPLETPFSVTAVPAERVREQAGTTLQDALRNVPGAQADSGFNGSHTQFFILRGAVTDSGTGSNRVLRDGVRLSNYPYVPAFVESVDVLRGPGAAVGVRSEPGGTVNLTTHQPRLENFGSVYLGGGSAGAQEVSVDLNRVLSQDGELAARITATRSNGTEWRHVPDRLDGIKLGLAKSDGGRYHLRAGIEATNQAYRPDYGVPALNGRPVDVPRDRQFGEPFGDSTTNNRIADLHGDIAVGSDTRLAVDVTRLEANSTSIKNTLTGSPLAGQPAGTYARMSSWEPGTTRRIDSLATSLTSWQAIGDVMHQVYLGVDYYREFLDQPSLSVPASTSPNINVFDPLYGRVTAPVAGAALARTLTTENLKAIGATAQDKVDFGAWSVVAGVRFDRQTFLYGATGVLPVEESRWSPKLAVLHRNSDTDTVYASVSTGTSPNQVSSSRNQSLPSRRSAQAEVGWKSLWRGGDLISELAIYRLDQSNMISSDLSTPSNNFDFTTAGSARSQGLEASLTGALTDRLNLVATYAYTNAGYGQNSVYAGKRVPNVARHVLSVWGQYRWDAAWKTGVGVYAQSRRFADEDNSTVLPGYTRVDLVQTWTTNTGSGQLLEVQLALRNLLDTNYYVSSHLHVSRWITPGQGRNLALSATYRF
ncbi:TonB-dependent receptor [Polaromonas sp. YR568]|uniref:TonB-dependent receptor n=1 Tax=Polaromonas sp. YR568 TaxID=1855301 RepID=UPI00398BC5D5